jgi:hypothetical protein
MFSRIYIDKVFLCLHNFFSLNPSKSLGNAAFLDVQTEQVMHILQVFLQKTTKSSQNGKRLLLFFFLFFNKTSVLILKTKTSLHFIVHVNFL